MGVQKDGQGKMVEPHWRNSEIGEKETEVMLEGEVME